MAIIQTALFTGMGRPGWPPTRFRVGSPIKFVHTHTFAATVESTDILELFEWPAHARFGLFTAITANVGAINVEIGPMTGTLGDTAGSRALVANRLITATAANTTMVSTLLQRVTVGKNGDMPLGVGLQPASNITAAANKTITFEVEFY
jgi:hypothetical protein